MTDMHRISCRRACTLALAAVLAVLAQDAAVAQSSGASSRAARANRSGDYIVAVVNTELVTSVEVSQRQERATADARRAGGSLPTSDALRQQALDSLIDERVLITYARDIGQKVDDSEVDRAVANIAAQNQLTLPQLRDRIKADGLDFTRFRNNLRDQLLIERVREREVAARIRIADNEIDQAIAEYRAKASSEVAYNLAQILVTVPEGATPEVEAQRRALMAQAQARVAGGEDFAKVAMAVSEDGKRDVGGEIGLRPANRLPDLFVDAVKGMSAGQVTAQPVRSPAGFHLLKVLDKQEGDAFKVTQTHPRHILLRVADREQADAVVRRMGELRRQIGSGSKRFEVVAKEVSEDGSAEAGGDLGWVAPGSFVPEFEEAMNKLAINELSAPVVSRFGVHLIQVTERRDVVPAEKEIREQARNQLREQKYEQAYIDWVKELRLRAYVEMREPPQ